MQHSYRTPLLLSLALGALPALAQQPIGNINPEQTAASATSLQNAVTSSSASKGNSLTTGSSFEEFLEEINEEMRDFQRQVVENYAKWLEGEWETFEPTPPQQRYTQPKPDKMPAMEGAVLPARSEKNFVGAMDERMLQSFSQSADTRRIIKDAQYRWKNPEAQTPGDWFTFYDMDLRIPMYDYQIMGTMAPMVTREDDMKLKKDASAQWVMLEKERVGEVVGGELKKLARSMNLNDYLTFELTCSYVNAKFPDASKMARTALVQYLMMHQGYDTRLVSGDGHAFVGLTTPQNIYGYGAQPVVNNGTACLSWLFSIEGDPYPKEGVKISLYSPQGYGTGPSGKTFDFRLNPLNIPQMPVEYCKAFGDIELTGTVNAMMMPIVRRYPQMETEGFAESIIDPAFHEDLVRQIKEQFSGLSPVDATNKLLTFIQYGFDYATDDEQHGYEKPYFLEENFFYPANDCEDRSILFTYLLWNALGIESQMLAYPGHESASVHLPESITNNSYYYNYAGEPFVIADPTYYDAQIGDAMPDYRNMLPERVDLYYNEPLETQRKAERAERQAQNRD